MKKERIPRILWVARDDGGCGYYRCTQPAEFIKRMGLAETEVVLKNPTEKQLLWADLVIIQELGSVNGSNIVKFLIKNRVPYIAEFDDFIHHVSPHNVYGYPAWNPSTLYTYRAMEAAKSAFAIQVSTPQLAREFFPYNPTVYVVPNYLDKELWDNPVVKRNDDRVRIGWMGGNAHADDLKMISGVLDKLVKENKDKIIVETMGMTKRELEGVFPFPDFNTTCPHCGFEGDLHHLPGEDIKTYPIVVSGRGWDIAVAPVVDNAFGNAKSDLKLKEYGVAGIATVASAVTPYREAVEDGANVALVKTFEDWYTSIDQLIKDPLKRDEMAKKNKEWATRYWVQDSAQKTFEVYAQVLSKAAIVFGKHDVI